MYLRRVSVACGIVLCSSISATPVAEARPPDPNHPVVDYLYPLDPDYNGIRVFLSPAWHLVGDKAGCSAFGTFYSEERNMREVAEDAAVRSQEVAKDLASRGYWVRIGNGDPYDNPRLSNEFGAAVFIALHSNGTTGNGTTCSGERGGTETFNRSGNAASSFLAERLLTLLRNLSPGVGDKRIPQPCPNCFIELRDVQAPRAVYLEAGFHDFRPDANWLLSYRNWAWRIGYAVDLELGYP